MVGIENRIWLKAGDHPHVWAIANEDLEGSTDEKTSSVHFLRFELTGEMIRSARSGVPLSVGVEHENYCYETHGVDEAVRLALVADLT